MSRPATKHWEITTTAIPHVTAGPVGTDLGIYYRLPYGEVPADELAALDLRWSLPAPTVVDWPKTDFCGRVVSDRVKVILEENQGPKDRITWVPGTVRTTDGTDHQYWIAVFFPAVDDVERLLHPDLTTGDPSRGIDGLIRWVLREDRLEGHHVYAITPLGREIIVAPHVYKQLKAAGITGATYDRVRSAPYPLPETDHCG